MFSLKLSLLLRFSLFYSQLCYIFVCLCTLFIILTISFWLFVSFCFLLPTFSSFLPNPFFILLSFVNLKKSHILLPSFIFFLCVNSISPFLYFNFFSSLVSDFSLLIPYHLNSSFSVFFLSSFPFLFVIYISYSSHMFSSIIFSLSFISVYSNSYPSFPSDLNTIFLFCCILLYFIFALFHFV